MKTLEYIAELEGEKTLKEYLPTLGLSVTLIRKIKHCGIFVDGESCTVRKTVKQGSKITLILPDEKSDGIEPIDIPLNVVYEDDWLLVVDKPTNMPTHPSRGNNLPTLANAVMAKYKGDFVFRSITRLDRDTSGLVLIAKDANTTNLLSKEIKRGRMYKRYVDLVAGIPKKEHGIIDAPIRREAEGSMKRIVSPDGKPAVTEYFVKEIRGENTLCDVILHTGRTHQIRVHFAHIGHPLLGDFLYGERRDEGYYLRCSELRFTHPHTKEAVNIRI
ncbi:MAG: RluA family pseudouridine synthase [Clostridia bacterium]|nr:RluA family pseudouridine synthase [Clostridia bacterium]